MIKSVKLSILFLAGISLVGCDNLPFDPAPANDILKNSGLNEIVVFEPIGSFSCYYSRTLGIFHAKTSNGSYISGLVCGDGRLFLDPLIKF